MTTTTGGNFVQCRRENATRSSEEAWGGWQKATLERQHTQGARKWGRRVRTWRQAWAVALLVALGGCAAAARGGGGASDAAAEIEAELLASAEGWNRGSLDAFLEPYLDSPQTTFVGSGGVVRGKEAIAELYRRNYFGGATPLPTLRFGSIEVRPLGSEHALALGRYQLYDAAGALTAEGPFSLVFARTPDGWRIVHDHSS